MDFWLNSSTGVTGTLKVIHEFINLSKIFAGGQALGAAGGGGCGGGVICHGGWGKAFGLVGGGNGEIPAVL